MKSAQYATSVMRLAKNLAGNALTDALEGGTGQMTELGDFAYALSVMFDEVDYDRAYDQLKTRAMILLEEMEADLQERA